MIANPIHPRFVQRVLFCAVLGALSGCTTVQIDADKKVASEADVLKGLITPATSKQEDEDSLAISPISAEEQEYKSRQWLRDIKVDFVPKEPVKASELIKILQAKDINITSSLPLDTYFYNGYGIKNANGEAALQILLGHMGLDYEVDNRAKFVTIIPMKSRTWTIPLGNRVSSYSGSNFAQTCTGTGATSGGSANPTGGTTNGTGGMPGIAGMGMGGGAAPSTGTGATTDSTAAGSSSASSTTDFWTKLERELANRLVVLMPAKGPINGATPTGTQPASNGPVMGVPAIGGANGSANGGAKPTGGNALYTRQTIGDFSTNSDTGAVTVTAPAWKLREIDAYMQAIFAQFNTSMTFEGVIVNVRSTVDKTEGIDLASLTNFAGRYGVVVSNNILGGVALSATNGQVSASYSNAATLPGAGAVLGVTRDNLQIFNAFLKTTGGAETVSKPVVTVTSGMPIEFGRLTPVFTNEPTQQMTGGTANAGALVTVQNNIIKHLYGSTLRLMPHYDPQTKTVRALVSLLQQPLVGSQPLMLSVIGANGTIQAQPIDKPLIECSVTSTETILKDGEMIIIGGQVENVSSVNQSGINGLMDVKLMEWLASQRRDKGSKLTTYFALRVRLNQKPL